MDCIYEGERKLYINPRECIDCGACEPVCPVEAISHDRRVGDDELDFVADNRRFFTDVLPGRDEPIGAPGGRTRLVLSELTRRWWRRDERNDPVPVGARDWLPTADRL